jgi:DNA recombination protein RmuC
MPVEFQIALAVVFGLGLGFLVGWLTGRGRAGTEIELRRQLGQREAESIRLNDQLSEAASARAAAEARHAAVERLLAEQRDLHEKTILEAKQTQEKALRDLREAFKALSVDALKETAPEFVRLAEATLGKYQETAKGDLAQRQEAIKTLVEPLKQQLETYQRRLQQGETAQAGALGEVKKQLETLAQSSQTLATETAQFRSVLKSNQARGRWGEETLRRVVEAAGLSPHCDFVEQSASDEGKPDLIVKLPGDRMVIVDSKVPDLDVVNAVESAQAGRRAELLAAHAGKLRQMIKGLSEREYPRQFPNALDHVVLFLPAESLFSAALEGDPELIVWAESKRVYLATPASFIAVLRTIDFIWQQHSQNENAREIAEAARELFTRVCKFTEHFEGIGGALARANNAFNDALRSYERMVRPSGERLVKLGAGTAGKRLAEPKIVETGQQQLI